MKKVKEILKLSCPDQMGIVAAVSGFLAENDCFILESHQFGDVSTDQFFMRVEFLRPECLEFNFEEIAERFSMQWQLNSKKYKPKVLVMVSKQGHCLNAVLNKAAMGDLQIEISAIVSNHPDLEKMANWYEIPYHITKDEKKVLELIDEHEIDLVVLARYMQILSPAFVNQLPGKIINIHHSFLPGFKGAKPYHQAFDKGVKLIGATAHYVTADLDEGPIIEQEVTRVDHTQKPKDLVSIGQDIEATTLVRAIKWHTQQRVFLDGTKTVVFR